MSVSISSGKERRAILVNTTRESFATVYGSGELDVADEAKITNIPTSN